MSTVDAPRSTWAPVPQGSAFGVSALPYGVFSSPDHGPRLGVRVGDHVLDLAALVGSAPPPLREALTGSTLDTLLASGPPAWAALRGWVRRLLTDPAAADLARQRLRPLHEVRLHLPFTVADYVDFYASEHHATAVGEMFRPGASPLPPHWKRLPIGYHGRAGTVVVSGTDVVRPCGLRQDAGESDPTFGPTRRLDVEAEVGFVVGVPSAAGTRVPTSALGEHVFGVVLVNDWSARDLQTYETVPLGPFQGKSFATSVSAWVLPLAALEAARVPPPTRDVPVNDHLADVPDQRWGLDLELVVQWNGTTVSRPPFAGMYWTPAQMLAHLTANGAALRTGDLFASGTVSGPDRGQRGSFLELSWNGTEQVRLLDGSLRTFCEDGDVVTITATAPAPGGSRVGLGEVTGRVMPAV